MNKTFAMLLLLITTWQGIAALTTPPIPHLRKNSTHTQLIVEGKPFLLLSGELHNSTSSALPYFREAVEATQALHLNSIIASVAWEQFEPQEGVYDYTLIDGILEEAQRNNLKIVLLWFASWKNGESSYTPLWVKTDSKRFFRVVNAQGRPMTAVSPLCQEAMKADARAFSALMQRIKEKDTQRNVVMVQPENEVGAFAEMDHSKAAQQAFNSHVPQALMDYMTQHRLTLQPELLAAWKRMGYPKKGSWKSVFGEENLDAQNFFLSWNYATYIEYVCKMGKRAYDLPMFVNAWLVQYPGEKPGRYPNGGPVSRVIDLYRAAAPSIDFISPDIYLPNFREVCAMYHLPQKSNPLFIPECERSNPGKAYYAMAQHDALGFSPFGVESIAGDQNYQASYAVLRELLPLITHHQGKGSMRAVIKEGHETDTTLVLNGVPIQIEYNKGASQAYGIIIHTATNEYTVVGINMRIRFGNNEESSAMIAQVEEGGYRQGKWYRRRMLNGDETWHNSVLFVRGRHYYRDAGGKLSERIAPAPILYQELESNLKAKPIIAPAVYKVTLYSLAN